MAWLLGIIAVAIGALGILGGGLAFRPDADAATQFSAIVCIAAMPMLGALAFLLSDGIAVPRRGWLARFFKISLGAFVAAMLGPFAVGLIVLTCLLGIAPAVLLPIPLALLWARKATAKVTLAPPRAPIPQHA